MGASRLMEKTQASRKTLYRALGTLKEAELVVEKDGIYYYFEDIGVRVYESKADHELALKHSEKLVLGLDYLVLHSMRGGWVTPPAEGERYKDYAIMHLKTGYRELSELYEKLESIRRSIDTEKEAFQEKFREKLLNEFPSEILYPAQVFTVVYEDIMNVLRGSKHSFLGDFKVEDRKARCGAYALAEEELAERLKIFLEQEEASKENIDHCRKIAGLENQYFETRSKFDKEIELLKLRVENGTPLQGRCSICPNIKVRS